MAQEDLSKLRIDKAEISSRRSHKRRYVLLILGLTAAIVAGALYRKGMLKPAVEVRVATVQTLYPSQTFTLLNASGYVVAQRKAAVAAKITGRLESLAVEEGSRVKAGDLIARLENADALAARDRAQANVEVARFALQEAKVELEDALRSYNRKKDVVQKGYISQLETDTAEARYRKAEAAVIAAQAGLTASEAGLREAKALVDYASIRAPFDAVVLTKDADIGDIVTPLGAAANAKAAVVTIADMDSLQVEADVSESNIGQVKVGQPCELQLDALPDVRLRGKVHMIVPTADRSKASVMVKVAFLDKDPRILPEMSAKVAFLDRDVSPGEEKAVKALPSSCVLARDGKEWAFVVRNGRAVQSVLRTGRRLGDFTEILDGADVGERVILSLDNLGDGAKVKPLEE